MFDVDNKSAVERLAAVVAMLERREAEARQAYGEVMNRFYADESAQVAWRADEIDALGLERHCARAKWLEAKSALAAVYRLTQYP